MKLTVLPVLSLTMLLPLAAEDGARLKSATVSFGDTAFTSGLNVGLTFGLSKTRELEIVGNSERFYTTLNHKLRKNLSVDVTGGAFKKLPWVGPRITYYPLKPIMLLYWGGWSPGRIGALRPEVKSFFQQASVYVNPLKSVALGYNVVKLDAFKTTHIPEFSYTRSVTESIAVSGSVSYDSASARPLLCVSVKHMFK